MLGVEKLSGCKRASKLSRELLGCKDNEDKGLSFMFCIFDKVSYKVFSLKMVCFTCSI